MKILALIVLCLGGCAAPLGRLNPGAQVPYVIVTDAEMHAQQAKHGMPQQGRSGGLYQRGGMEGLAASWVTMGWHDSEGIKELHAGGARWLAAHECGHAGDKLGSYRAAIVSLTPPGEPNEHMAKRLASMWSVCKEAEKRGVCHWRVIRDRWGNEGVVHQSIIDRLEREDREMARLK